MSAEFKFNSDLLRSEQDRKNAEAAYQGVFFALDDPDVRLLFEPRDDAANAAKKLSRRRGILAVILVMIALVITAFMPVVEVTFERHHDIFAAAAAVIGVLGGYFGLSGVLFGDAKRAWLKDRFMTERLRQLHFQTLLAYAPLVIEAARTGDHAPFLKARAAELARFQGEQIAHLDGKFAGLFNQDSEEEQWLPVADISADIPEGPQTQLFLNALAHLRINHQIDFAEYKLSVDERLFSSLPFRQIKVIDAIALLCVILLLSLDFLVLAGVVGGAAPIFLMLTHAFAISFAIVALALRTLEGGLQPHSEVERYRHYGVALRLIRSQFKKAKSSAEKIGVLKQLEQVSYEEMVSFLRSNDEAKFVM